MKLKNAMDILFNIIMGEKIINDGTEASTRKSQLVFRLFKSYASLKTSLRFPCLGLNPIIDSINLKIS